MGVRGGAEEIEDGCIVCKGDECGVASAVEKIRGIDLKSGGTDVDAVGVAVAEAGETAVEFKNPAACESEIVIPEVEVADPEGVARSYCPCASRLEIDRGAYVIDATTGTADGFDIVDGAAGDRPASALEAEVIEAVSGGKAYRYRRAAGAESRIILEIVVARRGTRGSAAGPVVAVGEKIVSTCSRPSDGGGRSSMGSDGHQEGSGQKGFHKKIHGN